MTSHNSNNSTKMMSVSKIKNENSDLQKARGQSIQEERG